MSTSTDSTEYEWFKNLETNGVNYYTSSQLEEIDTARRIVCESDDARISDVLSIDDCFKKILCDPTLHHHILKKIYPNGYHCTTYSSNTLRKDVDNRFWHCDYPYHEMQEPYPEQTLGIQVIWTLDDFTRENGATQFIAGSHKTRQWPDPTVTPSHDVRELIVPKGSVVVFYGKLWHTQSVNKTDTPRSALLANFSPLYIKAKDDPTNFPTFS